MEQCQHRRNNWGIIKMMRRGHGQARARPRTLPRPGQPRVITEEAARGQAWP